MSLINIIIFKSYIKFIKIFIFILNFIIKRIVKVLVRLMIKYIIKDILEIVLNVMEYNGMLNWFPDSWKGEGWIRQTHYQWWQLMIKIKQMIVVVIYFNIVLQLKIQLFLVLWIYVGRMLVQECRIKHTPFQLSGELYYCRMLDRFMIYNKIVLNI